MDVLGCHRYRSVHQTLQLVDALGSQERLGQTWQVKYPSMVGRYSQMSRELYVQYGCGMTAPLTWRNFDASRTLVFERLPLLGLIYTKNETRFPPNVEFGDIVKGLPIPAGTCKLLYCSHVLEHLSLEDFRRALLNSHRLLERGGTFRMVLPDLEYIIRRYFEDHSPEAALTFMRETGLGEEKRSGGLKRFLLDWLGHARHLWMWDYKSIEHELISAGFIEVRRAYLGDAIDPMFNEVEERGRWDNCLGLECRK